ncbi:DUF7139 domain-containing protein [Salinigranum marinum]|uniref:DUF7139 domain-containing protein n=1 Tax=Salinigranum marinum TaxID=1515595 RepID=UPI002989FB93|nr:permease [Salinigranum marinum]
MDASQDGENLLLGLYRRYVGPPEAERTVYGGFGLFFGGIGLALIGIVVFLASATVPADDLFRYTLREIAGGAGAVGLPALLLGVTVLLPVDRKVLYAAGVGTAVCLVGVGLFAASYPYAWNVVGSDRSGQVVAVYAAGIVAVIGATGAALVGHHIDRASTTTERVVEREETETTTSTTGETATVTADQVRRDIDEAMADSELSWGGVEKTKTKRLQLNTAEIDEIDGSNVADVEATTVRSAGRNVDDAVDAMKGLRGGETKQARSTQTTDDQTAALQALRDKQAAEELSTDDESVVGRLRNIFS